MQAIYMPNPNHVPMQRALDPEMTHSHRLQQRYIKEIVISALVTMNGGHYISSLKYREITCTPTDWGGF
jgi:hypothetical protein